MFSHNVNEHFNFSEGPQAKIRKLFATVFGIFTEIEIENVLKPLNILLKATKPVSFSFLLINSRVLRASVSKNTTNFDHYKFTSGHKILRQK